MSDFVFNVSVAFTIVPFFVSTLMIKRLKGRLDLMLLWLFFGTAAITEIVVDILTRSKIENVWILHIYCLLEYIIVLNILGCGSKTNVL
jgi:hypothetical protein